MRRTQLTAEEAKRIDERITQEFGLPALVLMDNAGRAIADNVCRIRPMPKKIAIFSGKGNNGGDGLCAARHLLARGINPDVYLCAKYTDLQGEAKVNLDILLKLKKKPVPLDQRNLAFLLSKISVYQLIIDALLGVGLKGEVFGLMAQVIQMINKSQAYILSVDIPSGLDATSGRVLGQAVKADRTITFFAPKRGMMKKTGRIFCGRIQVDNLGFPLEKIF